MYILVALGGVFRVAENRAERSIPTNKKHVFRNVGSPNIGGHMSQMSRWTVHVERLLDLTEKKTFLRSREEGDRA